MGVLDYRKYTRVEVELAIQAKVPHSDLVFSGYLSNISEEGGSFICSQSLPVATIVDFQVMLPLVNTPVQVKADVLWSRPVSEDGKALHAHGLLFNRIGIEDREQLHQFILRSMGY